MKKILFKLLATCFAVVFAFGVVGCSSGSPERQENVVTIRAYKGGYGTSFLTKLTEKFNTAYASKGYKVKLLTPSATLTGATAQKEMYSKDDWTDIYYVSTLGLDAVVNNADYGTLVYDIEDGVMNQKAIKFDGTEEDKTVVQKLVRDYAEDTVKVNGKRYAMGFNVSMGGLLVNTKKLSSYGLQIPKTTNEMIACFDAILCGNDANGNKPSTVTNQYPITYLGGTNGYYTHFYYAWVAQYEGADWWDRFWAYKNENGETMTNDGYTLYQAKGLEEGVKMLYETYDFKYRAQGSAQNTLATAHAKLMNSSYGAVFMADGEWAYNEVYTDYKDYMNDLSIMNIPIISALGVKLFGAGTSYNFDDAKCDEILSYAVGKTDEGKTSSQIVADALSEKSWTLNESDVVTIMNARGIYVDRGMGPGSWFVCNKTENREICNLFLRMLASDDAAKLIAEEAHMKSIYTNDYSGLGTTGYWGSFANIIKNEKSHGIYHIPTGLRKEKKHAEIFLSAGSLFTNTLVEENVSGIVLDKVGDKTTLTKNYRTYAEKSSAFINKEIVFATNNWNK